jgi:hypothetical protein
VKCNDGIPPRRTVRSTRAGVPAQFRYRSVASALAPSAHAGFVLRGVGFRIFRYGRRSLGGFPLRRKLAEFLVVMWRLSFYFRLVVMAHLVVFDPFGLGLFLASLGVRESTLGIRLGHFR